MKQQFFFNIFLLDPDAMEVDTEEDRPLHNLNGIFSLEEMKAFAEARGICPYFLTRYLIQRCDVVIYSYQYATEISFKKDQIF